MKCEKCGRDTKGFRRNGPGHTVIPYCQVCFYPKRWAYCGCGRIKGAKSSNCHECRSKQLLQAKKTRLEADLAAVSQELDHLTKLGAKFAEAINTQN